MLVSPGLVPTLRDGGKAKPAGVPDAYLISGSPRLLAVRQELCNEESSSCSAGNVISFAERPAELTFRFSGGSLPGTVLVNGREYGLPPGESRSFAVAVGPGPQLTRVVPSWQSLSVENPQLDGVEIRERGRPPAAIN
jgi:hypothetical protein